MDDGIGNAIDKPQKNGAGNYWLTLLDGVGVKASGGSDTITYTDDADGNGGGKYLG